MADAVLLEANTSSLSDLVENALSQADGDRRAVTAGARSLSYGQLDVASASLAEELADGSGIVAIVLPRGAEAITAAIACIRSGRPFLPLSPDAPERAAETIVGTGATTVISDLQGPHPWETSGARTVLAGSPPDRSAAPERTPSRGHPGGLGYLLTTSGTSGPPKLVRGSARGLARYLRWQRLELSLGPTDVLSHIAQPWFDFSFKETLGAITAGATVAVVPTQALASGRGLLTWLATAQPTTVCLLPSRLVMLTAAMERAGALDPLVQAALRRLRWLLVSGESFSARHFERWRAIAPGPTVLNLYGPTESTVIKLRHILAPGTTVSTPTVPVGTPIPGTQVELLPPDEDFPGAGDSGELCLVSEDLALGYAGDPGGSTRFDRDEAGRPRLRTGDVARRTPDGAFELLGRVDHMVKRRGVKVSLSSIEAAAQELPAVDSAAAVDCHRSQAPGDSSTVIVLFCGMSAGVDPDSLRRVRAGLVDRLDLVAMPDLIRLLPELPVDNRGKADRAVLRAWTATLADGRGRT
jgi:non-ribosomal peptide synthetase component F